MFYDLEGSGSAFGGREVVDFIRYQCICTHGQSDAGVWRGVDLFFSFLFWIRRSPIEIRSDQNHLNLAN